MNGNERKVILGVFSVKERLMDDNNRLAVRLSFYCSTNFLPRLWSVDDP